MLLPRHLREEFALFIVTIPAGFPSPAEDYAEGPLDLNRHLIAHPAATFFVRVKGDSMVGAGIYSGDLLTVDRALTAAHNSIVVAVVNGDITIKRLHKVRGCLRLMPENPNYSPIEITPDTDFEVWGVVTNVIRRLA